MTYDEFRVEVKAAKLSLREFAMLLKLNPNSLTNYKAIGAVPDHIALIAALIRELVRRGIEYERAIKRVRVKPKAPRGRGAGAFGSKPSGMQRSRVKPRPRVTRQGPKQKPG